MKPGAIVAVATLVVMLVCARGAAAANVCMSTPLATFDGSGKMSPDGKYLAAGGRLFSLPELRVLGSVPEGGEFTADSRHYYEGGATRGSSSAGLDFVDVAAPGAPQHLAFATTLYAQVSPLAKLVLMHPTEYKRPDPDALGDEREYYTWRLLRTSDGAEIAHSDKAFEFYDLAVDASESHVGIYAYSDKPKANLAFIVDVATGQVRELRLPSGDDGKVAISPDGSVAVTNVYDDIGGTDFWDVASGNRLGRISGRGTLDGISADSNWFFLGAGNPAAPHAAIALRAGNWSSMVAVPALDGVAGDMEPSAGGMIAWADGGRIGAIDGNLQRRFAATLGDRYWNTPRASAQGEVVAWASTFENEPNEGAKGISILAVLDGQSGRVLCSREAPPPSAFEIGGVSATQIAVIVNSGKPDYKNRTELYAIEDEAAAGARVEREARAAKAQSAKLSPTKKAEAQGIFKQAFDLFQSGEFDAAVKLFDSGLAIDPGNAPANYYLGETYARLKDNGKAALYYTRTVAIAPNTKEGALAATRLGN